MSDEERSRLRLQAAVGDVYRVGRLIGRGGFAEVFEASDPRLDRSVAIKVVRPDLVVSEELLERFLREARAMAGLRHPHVMEVYTVGEADGVAYFVMPLIAGESLGARLEREGSLPIDEAIRVLIQAAGALESAHGTGTIHRDIKPDNILLEGADGRVVLTDFGIAKALGADSVALTGTGMFMGTPRYMSPEQAVGDEVDHRSDIYSLGVVAYEMIAGRLPFEARTPQALVAQHLTAEPPPLWAVRPECPEHLGLVVRRCLAKDPGDRWASLSELVAVLEGRAPAPAASAGGAAMGGAETLEAGAGGAASDPLRAFHRQGLLGLSGVTALGVADAWLGWGGVSAWAGAACVIFLATRAGRLWAAGHEWRAILLPGMGDGDGVVGPEDLPGVVDGDFARFGTLIHGCTADRAAILKAFGDLSRQEQTRFPYLRETTESLLQRVRHLARRVTTLEERISDTAQRLEKERDEPHAADVGRGAPARARYEARLQELNSARDGAARDLRIAVTRLEELRDSVVERLALDGEGGRAAVDRSLRLAGELLDQRGA